MKEQLQGSQVGQGHDREGKGPRIRLNLSGVSPTRKAADNKIAMTGPRAREQEGGKQKQP